MALRGGCTNSHLVGNGRESWSVHLCPSTSFGDPSGTGHRGGTSSASSCVSVGSESKHAGFKVPEALRFPPAKSVCALSSNSNNTVAAAWHVGKYSTKPGLVFFHSCSPQEGKHRGPDNPAAVQTPREIWGLQVSGDFQPPQGVWGGGC